MTRVRRSVGGSREVGPSRGTDGSGSDPDQDGTPPPSLRVRLRGRRTDRADDRVSRPRSVIPSSSLSASGASSLDLRVLLFIIG